MFMPFAQRLSVFKIRRDGTPRHGEKGGCAGTGTGMGGQPSGGSQTLAAGQLRSSHCPVCTHREVA